MDKTVLETRCRAKAKELLDKHFGDLVQQTVYEKPETLDEKYTRELPLRIEEEYLAFLDALKKEIMPGERRAIGELIDSPLRREMIREDYELTVDKAYEEATTVTLWEKISKSNHDDVAYFVGLLKQYSEELLEHMTNDFLNLGETL